MDCSGWVDDFLAYQRGEKAASAATIDSYQRTLRDFAAFSAGLDEGMAWDIVDEGVVRRWIVVQMEAGISVAYVRTRLSALRSFYRYLMLVRRIAKNPMVRVIAPKAAKPLPKFFRDDDINRLLDRLKRLAHSTPDSGETADTVEEDQALTQITGDDAFGRSRAYLIILLLYMTGMRASEMTGLDVGDVDLRQMQVKVTGKRDKQRIIPIDKEVADAVREYLPLRERELGRCARMRRGPQEQEPGTDAPRRSGKIEDASGALILARHGQRLDSRNLSTLVRKITGTVTTQKKRSPHVFRHTFATSMINNGSDLNSVKELLGHASLATTEVYTHTNFEELKRIYDNSHPRG